MNANEVQSISPISNVSLLMSGEREKRKTNINIMPAVSQLG